MLRVPFAHSNQEISMLIWLVHSVHKRFDYIFQLLQSAIDGISTSCECLYMWSGYEVYQHSVLQVITVACRIYSVLQHTENEHLQ